MNILGFSRHLTVCWAWDCDFGRGPNCLGPCRSKIRKRIEGCHEYWRWTFQSIFLMYFYLCSDQRVFSIVTSFTLVLLVVTEVELFKIRLTDGWNVCQECLSWFLNIEKCIEKGCDRKISWPSLRGLGRSNTTFEWVLWLLKRISI